MRRIKALMIGLLVACMACIAAAQKMDPEQRASKEVEQLSSIVTGISEQQQKDLKAVNLKHLKAMSELRKKTMAAEEATNHDKEVAKQKMMLLRKEKNEAYKKILSKEQYQQFEAWLAENQQKSKKGKKASKAS